MATLQPSTTECYPTGFPDASLQFRSIHAVCNGVRIGIEANTISSAVDLRDLLPPGSTRIEDATPDHRFSIELRKGCHPGQPLYAVRRRGRFVGKPEALEASLRQLGKHVQLCVAEHSPDHVFIHAGVVVWKGRAIVLPGRSFAGKSTLVWSLIQAGATYYSDEFAVIDSAGRINAFPVPVSLREANGCGRSLRVIPGEATRPVALALVLFAKYKATARWRPRALTPGITALRLLQNCVAGRKNPAKVLQAVSRLATGAPAYAGTRGEAGTVIDWIDRLQ